MRYSSTRGGADDSDLTFIQVVMRGLAHDGGLFVPNSIPKIEGLPSDWINEWRGLKEYWQVAFRVMRLFIDPTEIPDEHLERVSFLSWLASLPLPHLSPPLSRR